MFWNWRTSHLIYVSSHLCICMYANFYTYLARKSWSQISACIQHACKRIENITLITILSFLRFLHGFGATNTEPEYCRQDGFREAMSQFGRSNNLCTADLDAQPHGTVWMGMSHVFDMRFFTSRIYLTTAEAYLRTGGLWKHRWSDQSFWPLVMNLLAPGRSHLFSGWKYRHRGEHLDTSMSNFHDPLCPVT
jgi:hypothetical protein